MRRINQRLNRLSAGLVLALLASAAAGSAHPEFAGTWEVTIRKLDAPQDVRLTLQQEGVEYRGVAGSMIFAGRREQGTLQLQCLSDPNCGNLSLHLAGALLEGSGTLNSAPVTIRGRRPATRPYSSPRTFDLEPRQFTGVFTGSLAPVLTIFPGDSVHTRTLDAEGFDEHGARISGFINPQTGPFYIQNAMPGDTLAIHFLRIRPNRSTADMYGDVLAANALEPYSVRQEQKVARGNSTWNLDAEHGAATLAKPSAKLARFKVPMKPMLGCVGVAPPAGQSVRTVNLGVYGGNLDYSGVREGATLYLPVFQTGALLFIGDGHALQGDGELTGTGLETSMDVIFSVDLIRDETLRQPRIEDDEYVMVSGIAGSLSDALQAATSGMIRWLTQSYGLSPGETAMILGSSMRYDITEIVDPQIHVVAKLRKDVLAQIEPVVVH